ncbi:zinc finger protein 385D-like [Saccoglossus kowalevskii]|uniref:Zinc finger protein 346-like n=1 Tax=Saccoglossus kowalevskii TaxID=10224 RepID=A0ABM0MVB8_SACKO|nr:PREDICTED: zinc finger protein 346-like [Saccoglossus kowalevskii]
MATSSNMADPSPDDGRPTTTQSTTPLPVKPLFEKDFGGSGFTIDKSDVKSLEEQSNVTVSTGVKRKADTDNPSVPVPNELMELLHCKLCGIMLNSQPQAQAHYEGKLHKKRFRQYIAQQSIPANLPQKKLPTCFEEDDPMKNKFSFCELCSVSFTSVTHANSHYEGAKHAKRLRPSPPVHSKSPKKAYFCAVCNLSLNSKIQYDQHISSKKHEVILKVKMKDKSDMPPPPPPPLPAETQQPLPQLKLPPHLLLQQQNGQNQEKGITEETNI